MQLVKTLWGMTELESPELWFSTFRRIKSDGFDAIEASPTTLRPFAGSYTVLRDHLDTVGLAIVVQVQTCGYPVPVASSAEHIASLRSQCLSALPLRPVMFNVHGGKDSFTRTEAEEFFVGAVAVEDEFGIRMVHETHRRRIMYSPFVLRDMTLPRAVKLNADISHWTVVCGRCLEDGNADGAEFWSAVLAELSERCCYIHARVGSSEAPQVSDPLRPNTRRRWQRTRRRGRSWYGP